MKMSLDLCIFLWSMADGRWNGLTMSCSWLLLTGFISFLMRIKKKKNCSLLEELRLLGQQRLQCTTARNPSTVESLRFQLFCETRVYIVGCGLELELVLQVQDLRLWGAAGDGAPQGRSIQIRWLRWDQDWCYFIEELMFILDSHYSHGETNAN